MGARLCRRHSVKPGRRVPERLARQIQTQDMLQHVDIRRPERPFRPRRRDVGPEQERIRPDLGYRFQRPRDIQFQPPEPGRFDLATRRDKASVPTAAITPIQKIDTKE